EALGEAAARLDKLQTSFLSTALAPEETRRARHGAQLQRLGAVPARDFHGTQRRALGLGVVTGAECDLTSKPMHLRLVPALSRPLDDDLRLVQEGRGIARPSERELRTGQQRQPVRPAQLRPRRAPRGETLGELRYPLLGSAVLDQGAAAHHRSHRQPEAESVLASEGDLRIPLLLGGASLTTEEAQAAGEADRVGEVMRVRELACEGERLVAAAECLLRRPHE